MTVEKSKFSISSLSQLALLKDQEFHAKSIDEWVIFYNKTIRELAEIIPPPLPPVCQLQLVPVSQIVANRYNPNKMAPPENHLLENSIKKNGLTMPIIVNRQKKESMYVIIDGFHRYEILAENPQLQSIPGYIPAVILELPEEKRISASVRHNVARGVHQVELTANLIIQLKEMGWSNQRVCQELGMDQDEVLRMQQITGLASAFQDQDFSQSWV